LQKFVVIHNWTPVHKIALLPLKLGTSVVRSSIIVYVDIIYVYNIALLRLKFGTSVVRSSIIIYVDIIYIENLF
jgi:hypothetical protein